jgi:AAA+ ATPase superfamily predicted ATPase
MKNLIWIAVAVLLTACQAPQTVPEWKKYVEGSSMMKVEHFPLAKASAKDVTSRFNEFSERCLSKNLMQQNCGSFSCRKEYVVRSYIPEVKQEGSVVRLTLKRREPERALSPKIDDMLILVAEADFSKAPEGHVYAPKIGYGDLFGTAKGWMTGENKTCPSL